MTTATRTLPRTLAGVTMPGVLAGSLGELLSRQLGAQWLRARELLRGSYPGGGAGPREVDRSPPAMDHLSAHVLASTDLGLSKQHLREILLQSASVGDDQAAGAVAAVVELGPPLALDARDAEALALDEQRVEDRVKNQMQSTVAHSALFSATVSSKPSA